MKRARSDASLASCEILCPAGFSPELNIQPEGPEVLMLLSGKMQLFFDNRTIDMRYGAPVVMRQPYRVVCPQGPGTGRALRVSVAAGPGGKAPQAHSPADRTPRRRGTRKISMS